MKTPLTEHLSTILLRDLNELKAELDLVPAEHLWVTRPGIINPIGVLVVHVCGNLRYFIGGVLGSDGYVRDREAEFAVTHRPHSELQEELDRTLVAVERVLPTLSEADLQRVMPHTPPQHQGKTVGHFLVQLTNHLSRHRGQLNYLRRILAAEA